MNQHIVDDNTLSMFKETIQNLIALLETESNTVIEWFQNKKMMVKSGKSQAIIIDKKKKCCTNETLKIGDKDPGKFGIDFLLSDTHFVIFIGCFIRFGGVFTIQLYKSFIFYCPYKRPTKF